MGKIKLKKEKKSKESIDDDRVEKKSDQISSVIRLSHIPHGFYEQEMNGYFKQFGTVQRVRLLRNKKGHSSGIAFVRFTLPEVAEVAAETMDNYIMAEKRMRCRVLKMKEVPRCIEYGPVLLKVPEPMEARIRHAKESFKPRTALQEKRLRIRLADTLKKRMKKIEQMGIVYKFDYRSKLKKFEANVPKEVESAEQVEEEFEEELEVMREQESMET